jgi:hypothetical protein
MIPDNPVFRTVQQVVPEQPRLPLQQQALVLVQARVRRRVLVQARVQLQQGQEMLTQ